MSKRIPAPGALVLHEPDTVELIPITGHPTDSGVSLSIDDQTNTRGVRAVTILFTPLQFLATLELMKRVEADMAREVLEGRGGRGVKAATLMSKDEFYAKAKREGLL